MSRHLEIWRASDGVICVSGYEMLRSGGVATLFVHEVHDHRAALAIALATGWTISRDEVRGAGAVSFSSEWGRA
ncbi:MAG: hypothetical protein ACR652_10245 [Methylocystis sp.]|uniref:hypothetical protein n=1 Tax=Methylocystis sp. TaxID=1911079 RepID=UPI003DA476DC